MPIQVTCRCGQSFSAKDQLAGKKVKCPKCQQPLVVPSPAAADDSGLANLLDEGGVMSASPQAAQQCPSCGAAMTPGAIICVQCGYNYQLRRKMETLDGVDFDAPGGAAMTDAERMLAKAERELRESPREGSEADYGDGASSYLLMLGMILGLAVFLTVSGVALYFINEHVQESKGEGGSGGAAAGAMVAMFFGVLMGNVGGIWLVVLAFMEDITKGILCLLVPFYAIYYAFTQLSSNKLPAMLYLFGNVVCIVASLMMGFSSGPT